MAALDYRPDVDGLRAIAVVAVVLHHLSATLAPGGYVGVDVFELMKSGKKVVLVGSIPIYDRSVPFNLARTEATGRVFPDTNANAQCALHSTFFDAVRQIQNATDGAHFHFLDLLDTLCPDVCRVANAGRALYRDSHHVSVAGALALESDIARGLDASLVFQPNAEAGGSSLPSDEPVRGVRPR